MIYLTQCNSPILQFERDVDFPPVALGDLVDVADRDVILLEPELDGVADDVQILRQSLIGNGSRLVGHHWESVAF